MTVLWNYRTWEFIACTGLIFTSTFERELIEKINLTKMLNTSTTLRMESIYHFMSNAILDENIFSGVLVEYLPCRNNHPNNRSVKSDNKIHGAKMGTTWVLSAPDGHDVGPMNPDLRDHKPHECGNGLKSAWARRCVCFLYIKVITSTSKFRQWQRIREYSVPACGISVNMRLSTFSSFEYIYIYECTAFSFIHISMPCLIIRQFCNVKSANIQTVVVCQIKSSERGEFMLELNICPWSATDISNRSGWLTTILGCASSVGTVRFVSCGLMGPSATGLTCPSNLMRTLPGADVRYPKHYWFCYSWTYCGPVPQILRWIYIQFPVTPRRVNMLLYYV